MARKDGDTYALFDRGKPAKVVMDHHRIGEDEGPIKLIHLVDDKRVRKSAREGIWSAYRILLELSFLDKGDRFCISYEFEKMRDDAIFGEGSGESAGLTIALKFVQKVGKIPCNIAATGKISDHSRTSKVLGVEKIEQKIRRAVNILPEGGLIFYPRDNKVSAEVRNAATSKSVDLTPVATVREAIEKVLEVERETGKQDYGKQAIETQGSIHESQAQVNTKEGVITILKKFYPWLLSVLILVVFYLGGGFYFQYHYNRHHIQIGSLQEYLQIAYPWVDMYLLLDYLPKEVDTVETIEGFMIKCLRDRALQLKGVISSESKYVNSIYTVILTFNEGRVLWLDSGKSKLVGKVNGEGSDYELGPARIKAAADLLQKLGLAVKKIPGQ